MKTGLRAIAAAVGFFALGLQFWLEARLAHSPGLIASTIHFFSYFTILANTVAALAMLVPLVAPKSGSARFLSRPSVRAAIAGYLIIVGGTYFLYLRHIGSDQGLERLADQLMHYATPTMFLIDWLAFVPKGRIPLTMVGTSLLAPILYGIWTMVHGGLTKWYPYPFLDDSKVGHQKALVSMATFLGVFIAVALSLVVIDRIIGLMQRHDIGNAEQ